MKRGSWAPWNTTLNGLYLQDPSPIFPLLYTIFVALKATVLQNKSIKISYNQNYRSCSYRAYLSIFSWFFWTTWGAGWCLIISRTPRSGSGISNCFSCFDKNQSSFPFFSASERIMKTSACFYFMLFQVDGSQSKYRPDGTRLRD